MLGQLHIKNIGIIEEITINFTDGLNILTGETGAGKSLIIDSLNILTGSKISRDLIKTGTDMAYVEGCFFEKEENIILTREIYQNGRNICKINNKMVTLSEFKEVGGGLVDIHGQHDNQSLLNNRTHIELLDNFTGEKLKYLKDEYIEKLKIYKATKEELQNNFGDPIEKARRLDLLRYQIDEITNANLSKDEEDRLEQRHNILMNAEKIVKCLNDAYTALDEGVLNDLNMAMHELSKISSIDKKYEDMYSRIQDGFYILKDATSDISSHVGRIDFDENEQKEIEERLDIIYSLKRKYGNDIDDILKYEEEIGKELNKIENSDEIISKLQNKLNELEIALKGLAEKIREIRKLASSKLEKQINTELQDLEMKKAFIKFEFEEQDKFLDNGMDLVQMLICTNVGESLKPLNKIASGGEISRVMLAIKTVLCEYDNIPTMIFDEIDTGISGQARKSSCRKIKINWKNTSSNMCYSFAKYCCKWR